MDTAFPVINTTCPYHAHGLIKLWSRGRRDGANSNYLPPERHPSRGALEAYRAGFKLGTLEARFNA